MGTRGALSDFDIEGLADKTIDMLSVDAGQVIWIWASTYSLDLIEALALRIRQRGAFWTVRLTIESLLQQMGLKVPERYLGLIPQHEIRWLADVTAIVEVRDHGGYLPDIPLSRRRAIGAEWIALIDGAARQGCRRIHVVNPTPALAAAYGIPVAMLRHGFWQAVNVDYEAVDRLQEKVAGQLREAANVYITSPLGTDLHLSVARRPVHLDLDGIPRGEVYVAPHEDSAQGFAVIDRAFIKGQPVEHLRLAFEGGRVVRVEAPDTAAVEAFKELLSASTGDKDVIAEFAMGLNPGIAEPLGIVALDEKIGGSVHIAIGMNEHFGGGNRSNLHLDLVMLNPTVTLDGSPLVTDGFLSP
jgi:aminopeptidase